MERGGAEGGAVAASSPLPNEADKGWDPLSGLKSVTHLDFLPNNAHFINTIATQAYNLHVFVFFSELCEMAYKNR